jgi:hypothetical protein
MSQQPIVLNLYNPETQEVVETFTQNFVPWKMLKKGIALNKLLGLKDPKDYTEEDADAITNYIQFVFTQKGLTAEKLEEQSDLSEMMTVVKTIVSRAKGIMDPTLPPKA